MSINNITVSDVEKILKQQIAEDNKEKYNTYNRVIELATENQQLKEKLKQFKESNNVMADELKNNFDIVCNKLKTHQWSFDNDPNGELKKAVLELIA